MRGRLVVFEGTDGSGKSTQFSRLCKRLAEERTEFQTLIFPQYQEPSSALIRMYLNGEFGRNPSDVNAYAASTFYAADRYASYKRVWGEYYRQGGLVLADRYTTSNAVHQGAKIPQGEREGFFRWLFDFEYRLLGLPEPDLVFFLDLPTQAAISMMRGREQKTGRKADIHELDEEYLALCRQAAHQAAAFCGWKRIDCAPGGKLRTEEEIHEEIFALVREEGVTSCGADGS